MVMQLSEWNIFCHGWHNWAPKPSRHKIHFELFFHFHQSGQRVFVCQTIKRGLKKRRGWTWLLNGSKREIGIQDITTIVSHYLLSSSLSSPLDSENRKNRIQKKRKKWNHQRKENNSEWNFSTGKLFKNHL